MKKLYKSPNISICEVDYDAALLVASEPSRSEIYNRIPDKDYHCPYAPSLYCRQYSDYMNAFRKEVEYAAKHKLNRTFITREGCGYEGVCDVFKLYKFYEKNKNKQK